jgi:ribose transport system ATP-binding protein
MAGNDVLALRLDHISKSFGTVPVLDDVSLHVRGGSVHGLVGANGAGKSTLIKIISGFYKATDSGDIEVWGHEIKFPFDPFHIGVATVHQDLGLVGELTVLENLSVTSQFGQPGARPIGWRALRRRARALLAEFGLNLDLGAPVRTLDPSDQAGVAVMRALDAARHAGVDRLLLILDEPTVYFSSVQKERLFAIVRQVRGAGHGVVLVSHRLQEIFELCDEVSVLRNGRLVMTHPVGAVTQEQLIEDMLGYSVTALERADGSSRAGEVLLTLQDVVAPGLDGVSLQVRRGELVGVTGAPGAGQDRIPAAVVGEEHLEAGVVEIAGRRLTGRFRPPDALAAGLVLVPANRLRDAIWTEGSARENFTIGRLGQYSSGGFLRRSSEVRETGTWLNRLSVRPPETERLLATFSGGNQQKLVLARGLSREPRVLILHEPTQGVDAEGKREIMRQVQETIVRGVGVLMVSSDHEELARLCDRVIVLRDGTVATELQGDALTEGALVAECSRAVLASSAE